MGENQTEYRTTGLRVPRPIFIRDLIAGLVNAIVTIPGGIANGVLAGVNPVYGLYSIMLGTPIAALFTSSVIMNVDSTSATSLATLEALNGIPEDQHLGYMVVLGILVGLLMLLFGLRDRDEISSTFVRVIERYAKQLDSTGNRLILVGMNERILEQLEKTELMSLLGDEDVFPAEPQFCLPLKKAMTAAQLWIDEGN